MNVDDEDDIGAMVKAAMADPEAPPPAAAEAPAPAASDATREANGRFAAKAGDAQSATQEIGATPPSATEAQAEPIRPPEGLSAPVKAMWATLPREVQQDIERRERETARAIQERGEKLNQVEPIAKALEPVQHQLAMAGIDGAAFVRAMVSADQQLRGPNKQAALLQLAHQYGIQLPQGAIQGAPPQQQAHPQIAALERQVHELTQTQLRTQQQAETARQTEVQSVIEAFRTDPKNLYFANVQPRMAALLSSGVVDGATPQERLQNAYEAACYADPTVRPLLTASATAAANAGAKVQQARQAAGSITGAPSPGGSPARASNSNSSVEDDVREAFSSLRA